MALIAAGVALLTTTSRQQAATEAQGNANPFIDDAKLVTRIADF